MLQPPSSKSDSQFNCFDQKSSVPNKRLVIPRAEKTGRATQYLQYEKAISQSITTICPTLNLWFEKNFAIAMDAKNNIGVINKEVN
ncbi:hypothetical protein T05_12368 [Trichinella murrelli]|uniref:Uncharacterized protein n=1 Tax=Trichinella murrelli TaxID=144512 RepID=A0A0V0TZB6_9BILA|nr:hypothetical protein T05_12368 [Trichinella murrelli]